MLHNGVIVKKAKAVKYMRKKHVLVDLIKVYTDLDIALPNILTTCLFFCIIPYNKGGHTYVSPLPSPKHKDCRRINTGPSSS